MAKTKKHALLGAKALLSLVAFVFSSLLCPAGHSEPLQASANQKPVIGINVDIAGDKNKPMLTVSERYVEAVERSGGIPVLLPPMASEDFAAIVGRVDGVLLIGGLDYDPALYGEKPEPKVEQMDKLRNDYDYALVRKVVQDTTLPFLGICAGSQILNIGLGGSLMQDIPSDHPGSSVVHSGPPGCASKHIVDLEPNSKLAKIYGRLDLNVPTSHHQAVDKVGAGLKVVAHAQDGINEAVELPGDRFVVGVQWHPERDYDNNQSLFLEFVRQAAAHKNAAVASGAAQATSATIH